MASILIKDVTKLGFDFTTTPGSVIISYPGVDNIVVSGWRQWYTYISGGNLYFVDGPMAGSTPNLIASLQNNKSLAVSLGTSGGLELLIGNGDAGPAGGIVNFSTNITNESTPPTQYINVDITTATFTVKHS
jgi:hypothetical protein